jgi:hypothetical protein
MSGRKIAKVMVAVGCGLVVFSVVMHLILLRERAKCARNNGDIVHVTLSSGGVSSVCEAKK